MEHVGEDYGGGAGEKSGVDLVVLAEEQGGGEDAIDGLKVHREIGGKDIEVAQQVDVEGVGENGADPRKQQNPQPVVAAPVRQMLIASGSIKKRQKKQAGGAGTDHFP